MYFFLLPFLTAAAAAACYRLLRNTRLPQRGRLALSLLLGVLLALAILWAVVCLSILVFQINDPITM